VSWGIDEQRAASQRRAWMIDLEPGRSSIVSDLCCEMREYLSC